MRTKNFKININELRRHIELKTEYWVNRNTTNCYAYALGFDIPESIIREGAYSLGTIGLLREKIDPSFRIYYSKETRLLKDLKALKLKCVEASPYEVIRDDDKNSYFLISLFEKEGDFHFLRKSKLDNTWWHKRGWSENPKNIDDENNVITDPTKAVIGDYKGDYRYVKTYKIGFKRS